MRPHEINLQTLEPNTYGDQAQALVNVLNQS